MRRIGIQPMSGKRRAALAAAGQRFPSSTFASPVVSPPKPRARPVQTGPDQATVDAVLQRDGYSCVVCGGAAHGTRSVDWSIHHRLRRSQGGDNRPSNLVTTCGHGTAGDHGLIHSAPAAARKAGWMLRRGQDPEQVPMAHALHGLVFLRNDGGWSSRRPNQSNDGSEES
jgi:hypothetical protein